MNTHTRDEVLSHVAADFADQPHRPYPALKRILEGTIDELRVRSYGDTVVARAAVSLISRGTPVDETIGDVMDALQLTRDELHKVFGPHDDWLVTGSQVEARLRTLIGIHEPVD